MYKIYFQKTTGPVTLTQFRKNNPPSTMGYYSIYQDWDLLLGLWRYIPNIYDDNKFGTKVGHTKDFSARISSYHFRAYTNYYKHLGFGPNECLEMTYVILYKCEIKDANDNIIFNSDDDSHEMLKTSVGLNPEHLLYRLLSWNCGELNPHLCMNLEYNFEIDFFNPFQNESLKIYLNGNSIRTLMPGEGLPRFGEDPYGYLQ